MAETLRPQPSGRSAIFGHGHRRPRLFRKSKFAVNWFTIHEWRSFWLGLFASGGDIFRPKMTAGLADRQRCLCCGTGSIFGLEISPPEAPWLANGGPA